MSAEVKKAYDTWSSQYDSNENKTRDLERFALQKCLSTISFESCLEIGCGTGKNTEWLLNKAKNITAVDLSVEMLAKAKEKISSERVQFIQADVKKPWTFGNKRYDLVSFSLVLEHIENLEPVFSEASAALKNGGYVYVGELHPFKQYAGTKARFDTEQGQKIVECYNHNISDFTLAAEHTGLSLVNINEYFDDNDRKRLPRILTILLKKL
ncbi:MAG: class I SAM-dependent DNA methyltransferase [Flavisolibacter sp.]